MPSCSQVKEVEEERAAAEIARVRGPALRFYGILITPEFLLAALIAVVAALASGDVLDWNPAPMLGLGVGLWIGLAVTGSAVVTVLGTAGEQRTLVALRDGQPIGYRRLSIHRRLRLALFADR
jgi:hypothetical protein